MGWNTVAPEVPGAVGSGGSGVTSPSVFNLTSAPYNAKANGQVVTDVSATSGNPVISSASANFTPAMTGMSYLLAGGAGSNVPQAGTITYVSATQVSLSVTPGTNLTNGFLAWGTDDTPAINAAWVAAQAYMASNPGRSAVITGPSNIYILASPTTKVVSQTLHYNSQVPMTPTNTGASMKLTPVWSFGETGRAVPIFGQTVPQAGSGATFLSTLVGQTVDGTFGIPSVIGGPTDGGNSTNNNQWSNMYPVVQGLTIVVPLNPTIAGINFRGMAGAAVDVYAGMPFDSVANIAAVKPTSSWAAALYMPIELNNDEAFVGDVAAYGWYYGHAFYAHTSVQSVKSLYCGYGMFIGGNGNDKHGVNIGMASMEGCGTFLQCDGNANITVPVNIGLLDCEAVNWFTGFGGNHIQDPANGLGGTINVLDNSGDASVLSIAGAANCRILCANETHDVKTAPTYTLGTAFQNPWWVPVYITLNTGTTTNIQIGPDSARCTLVVGTTTAAPVTFLLPSGWWLNITGTVKPSVFNSVPF